MAFKGLIRAPPCLGKAVEAACYSQKKGNDKEFFPPWVATNYKGYESLPP
jgi:hypothetical protein